MQDDSDSLSYLISPQQRDGPAGADKLLSLITPDLFRPDGNLNAREILIAFPLPDWNQWLPRIHPKDAWGTAFTESRFAALFDGAPCSLRLALHSSATNLSSVLSLFTQWSQARRSFLSQRIAANDAWSAEKTNKIYSTQLWQLVKTWELMQEFSLEDHGKEIFGPTADSRTWWSSVPAQAAPASTHIPNSPAGVNGSALNNEYLNAAWYELQIVLNSGTHRRKDRQPVDWVYTISEFRDLYNLSGVSQPSRLLVAVIKALQSSNPQLGPRDYSQGWRPEQNVD